MNSRIRLIGFSLCLAAFLMVLPAMASAHGSAGSAVMDTAFSESRYSAGPDGGAPATGMMGIGDTGREFIAQSGAIGHNMDISGIPFPAGDMPGVEGDGSTTRGFSDANQDPAGNGNTLIPGSFSPGDASSGKSGRGGSLSGGSESTPTSSDRSFSEKRPEETQVSGQGTSSETEQYRNPLTGSPGSGPQNPGGSPGNGGNTGIWSFSGSEQNPGSYQKTQGIFSGSMVSGKAKEQQGSGKASEFPLQGMVLIGMAGGTVMKVDMRNLPTESMGSPGSHGPRDSFPESRGNPWNDSADKQLPPATTGVEPEEKNPVSRPKGKREKDLINSPEIDGNTSRQTPRLQGNMLPLILFPIFGYRRIHKKNVLQNEGRGRIFQVIEQNPGIDVITLSDAAGMNVNTVRYHLVKLIATGKISYLTRSGILRYYPNQGRYSVFEQLIIHYLRNSSTSVIIDLLRRQPGITRQDLADGIGISGPSVTRHMQQLIEDRIVINEAGTVTNHYRLSDESVATLGDLQEKMSVCFKTSLRC
jgi:predicted ArsR family transcriptional regulator